MRKRLRSRLLRASSKRPRTTPERPSESRADELPCGRELLRAPLELAVQLAAAKLGENLADAGRLVEPERGQIAAVDLQPHMPETLEIAAESRELSEPERVERGVRPHALHLVDDRGR